MRTNLTGSFPKRERLAFYCLSTVLLITSLNIPIAYAETQSSLDEYQVKAMFLYNFLRFVECSAWEETDTTKPIIIGILGDNPFGDSLTLIADKEVEGRMLVIKHIDTIEEIAHKDELKKFQVLFICSSEGKNLKKIFEHIQNHSILTVSDTQDFVENGGMINFVADRNRIRFEINETLAKEQNFHINSKLLKLAKKVI